MAEASPRQRRQAARQLQEAFGVSERRACRVLRVCPANRVAARAVAATRLAGRTPGREWSRRPRDLPHGVLKPPQEVHDAVAREKAKFPPEVYTRGYEERVLNDWTVGYVFGHQLGYYDD